jgi:hypothetical protein
MALIGKAALAMWWDIAPDERPEFEHWHSSEHFAERLAVAGFLRGSRWVAVMGAPYYFVMYELTGLDVLDSDAYRERVNHPTPWTAQTMARFRNMVRSQCVVTGSVGGGTAHAMLTLRFAPQAGQAQRLREWILQTLPRLIAKPGITGAHLIENAVPVVPLSEQTAEQKLRGGDATADWVMLVNGYDVKAVSFLTESELNEQNFEQNGAESGRMAGVYRLGLAQGSTPR